MQPDYLQLGNETNDGMLHPHGRLSTHPQQFLDLLHTASEAVRTHSSQTQLMVHFAGIEGADLFYDQLNLLNYDLIALSYYPIWHGKSLQAVQSRMDQLAQTRQASSHC